jgi:hypothetical protein
MNAPPFDYYRISFTIIVVDIFRIDNVF